MAALAKARKQTGYYARNMQNNKRGRGKPFVKGDPRIGRHALPPEIREGRRIAFREFNEIAIELLTGPYSDVLKITEDDNGRTDKRMIATSIRFGVEGNQASLNSVWERIYGKVPDKIEHCEVNKTEQDLSQIAIEDLKAIRDIWNVTIAKTK